MALIDLLQGNRMEMLKWVSERNVHVPLSDLAYMLDIGGEEIPDGNNQATEDIYDAYVD